LNGINTLKKKLAYPVISLFYKGAQREKDKR
jgi:hypothetical protein